MTHPFNPGDPETFNWSTSVPVYDSLGNVHTMTHYFAKRDGTHTFPDGTTHTGTYWEMFTLIDGLDPLDPTQTVPNTPADANYPTTDGFPGNPAVLTFDA